MYRKHAHYYIREMRQREELRALISKNAVDIYVMTKNEFIELYKSLYLFLGKPINQFETYVADIIEAENYQKAKGFLSDFGSTIADTPSITKLLRDMQRSGNILGKYYIQYRNNRAYIIFKGNHKLRHMVKGTRYLQNNSKMVSIGVGNASSIKQGIKGGFFISMFISITLNTIDWIFIDDYRWTNWLANISTDMVKVAISSIAGALAGIAVAAFLPVIGVSASVVATVGSAIAFGIIVGQWLNNWDQSYGMTDFLIKKLEKLENSQALKYIQGEHNVRYSSPRSINFRGY